MTTLTRQLWSPVANRWHRWWLARLQPSDRHVLGHRNVYIVPSGAGWMMGVTVLVLLVASINYQLNLGYLLTFLVAGAAMASMHVAHANLRGLVCHLEPPQGVFAGDPVVLTVHCNNPGKKSRFAVGLRLLPAAKQANAEATPAPGFVAEWSWVDVPGKGQTQARLAGSPLTRGRHDAPLIRVQTAFPLGLFTVWTLWRAASPLWVYPKPEDAPPPWPVTLQGTGTGPPQLNAQSVDFDGVRPYRPGDPLKWVVWKKAAKALALAEQATDSQFDALLTSRDRPSESVGVHWFSLAHTSCADREQALSRLTAWVLQAEQLGLAVGLELPGARLEPALGEVHVQNCLKALAAC